MGKKIYHKNIHRMSLDLVRPYLDFKESNYYPLIIGVVER